MKAKYLKPLLSKTITIIENGILAASGILFTGNTDATVYEEWEQETENRDIDW